MDFVDGLVSINILTWNCQKYIRQCLERCLSQNYKTYEVVIIDNNSSDDTLKICSEYSDRVKIIKNESNLGYSGGHNVGIRASLAQYILVLNPDVYLDEEYVKNIISFLDQNEDYGGAIGKIFQHTRESKQKNGNLYIDTMGLRILRSRQFVARNFGTASDKVSSKTGECFGVDGMAAIYRRTMLEEVKVNNEYFDEDFFAYCEDQDLSWRARKIGWKFAFVGEAIAFHVRTWKPRSLRHRREISGETKRMALRNHHLMILKNDEIIPLLTHFPHICFRFFKILIYAILFEQKTLLAFCDVLILSKNAIRKRRIKKNSKVTLSDIFAWFKLS